VYRGGRGVVAGGLACPDLASPRGVYTSLYGEAAGEDWAHANPGGGPTGAPHETPWIAIHSPLESTYPGPIIAGAANTGAGAGERGQLPKLSRGGLRWPDCDH